ncbi:MAG: hypothetical protein HY711_08745, partial [Candidatus Melainabacteria bacterium]|nr:hypothetical protein [Candidatus Melainabacteria bacterium]
MILNKRVGSCLLALFVVICTFYQPASGHRSTPQEVYQRAWQLVRDNYYDANFNGQVWLNWEHKFDGQLHSVPDAYRAVKVMLESLN